MLSSTHDGASNADSVLRIMSYNIRNGLGMDDKTDLERIAEVINRISPDIVAVQEVDSVTNRSRQMDILKEIAGFTGNYHVFCAAIGFDGGKYGIGILSKEEPLAFQCYSLPGREEARALLVVEFDYYLVGCVHFSLNHEDRLSSIDSINRIAAKQAKPFFLAGDFNVLPDSPEINRLTEQWNVLTDNRAPTFPADDPEETLDYIFVYRRDEFLYSVLQKEVINEPVASDHLPVFVDIRF